MAERLVCVAIKPVAPVLDVDWLSGKVASDVRHPVRTPADEAACAVGYALGRALGCEVLVASVTGPAAEGLLRATLAEGAGRALRVVVGDDVDTGELAQQWPSGVVADALAEVARGATAVVCGDASGDRGSATVPGRLAHGLGVAQALCLRSVGVDGGRLVGTRRLDAGRREHLALEPPCVVSVESGAASAPRAGLAGLIGATSDAAYTEVRVAAPHGARRGDPEGSTIGPYRPRPSSLRAPQERDAVRRSIEVVGSLVERQPPEVLRLDAQDAAAAILERLERWGMR